MKWPAILPAIALASCGQPTPVAITPPASLLTCADEPAPPALEPQDWTAPVETIRAVQLRRDRMMLDAYLALRSAYGDCRAKVDGTRAWSETLD